MQSRSYLLVAAGAAAGILAAAASPRPAAPSPPPQINVRTGHLELGGSVHGLTPRSVRIGNHITRLDWPGGDAGRVLVYLDVNGETVLVALGVEPAVTAPMGPPDPPAEPG